MSNKVIIAIIAFCGSVTIASLVAAIVFGLEAADNSSASVVVPEPPTIIVTPQYGDLSTTKPREGENPCDGMKVGLDNVECIADAIGPQAGGDVTKGYVGGLDVDHEPIKTPYFQNSMCPVNVHWHLGAEHKSDGEYDVNGTGPSHLTDGYDRRLAAGTEVRGGFRCNFYDASDPKFTQVYDWKHCVDMVVGETYEVHWPHSAAGACGTPNQYQTPFYDGVFCNQQMILDGLDRLPELVGVQAQVFTIVNDESYYYPDLFRGMIVDGEYGQDIAKYTGSTTGTTRNNEICSAYSPITWQVDRKCQLISASSFDKMCADMKSQRDDMSEDLYPHGSRELVDDEFTANNQVRKLRGN